MTHTPVPGPFRWFVNICAGLLTGLLLAAVLVGLVQQYVPGWLIRAANANTYWPTSWKYDYVHWLYASYAWSALAIGLIGGLIIYGKAYGLVRTRLSL